MYHSGLFFATLVVQLAMANGLPAANAYVRRDCSGCDDDDDDERERETDVVNEQIQLLRRKGGDHGCESGQTTCTSSPPATSTGSNTTIPTSTSMSTNTTSSSTSSSTMTSAPATQTSIAVITVPSRSTITTGGIIGVAFGSVVILGLSLILCITYLHRWRKARKRGKGFVPATYLGSPSNPQFPRTEMSQTQSSPIVASAVASRMTSTPPHHYPHSVTTTSLSPLIPAATLEHSRSFTSSSNRRTSLSYTDGSSAHEPVHSAHEMSSSSFGASLNPATLGHSLSALSHSGPGSTTSSSDVSEPSGLLRVLTGHQKALEAQDQKDSRAGVGPSDSKQEEPDAPEVNDPPPRYDA
ncbi:hypothetical protein BDN70DRAFT_452297 [Pholiota conissans]|uniref:Mid2 domain-containing protein n=1 Tax=Pholiota conissans TaxID=109636 RepID=A0A9P5Z8Q5_9AGAR|nr:hypothetical protein BDN70DRAFT_452297 [Pholiota conissans]